MKKQRLLKLAEFLETEVPARRFDMLHWADLNFEPTHCGTTACAMGWATTIPAFRRAGLRLDSKTDPYYVQPILVNERGRRISKKNEPMDAPMAFFGLTEEQATHLFVNPEDYGKRTRPSTIAKRIRKLVERA